MLVQEGKSNSQLDELLVTLNWMKYEQLFLFVL